MLKNQKFFFFCAIKPDKYKESVPKSMDVVKESKWKPQYTINDSESIHLNNWIDTGILFKPTSK
jgi:hypothetical protein